MIDVKKVKVQKEEVKQKLKFNKVQKIVVSGLVMTAAYLGFKAGVKYESVAINIGLNKCCETDPTLKEHLVNTICEVNKKQMMGN